jgi:hypothetical protein
LAGDAFGGAGGTGGFGGYATNGDGGVGGDGGIWGSNNGDDGYVTGTSSASADAIIDTNAFNMNLSMGANLQQNAVDMTVVGGALSSTTAGEDSDHANT